MCSISENQGCVRHQPGQVPDPAEHPGGGEGNVWSRVAQSGSHAGTDVAEKVTGLGGRVCVAVQPGGPALQKRDVWPYYCPVRSPPFLSHRLPYVMLVSS